MTVVYCRAVESLFGDDPLPILEGIGLVAVSLGVILASVARRSADGSSSQVTTIYWADLSRAGYVWATATALVLVAALAEIEGLREPLWLALPVLVGLACLGIARLRWRRLGLTQGRARVEDPSRPDHQRLVSTSWEAGVLGGAGGGLLFYVVTVAHAWGHPIHWVLAGIAAAIGYAVGIVLVTPRFNVRRARS